MLGALLLVGGIGCRSVSGPVVPMCPVPSAGAYSELNKVSSCCPGIIEYLGRVEVMCLALEEMRDE